MRRWLLTALLAVIVCSPATGQNQHPNQARGFNANGVYSSFDIDHINTFNGNLVITVPLGRTYPVNSDLSYSLHLIYNSNAWSPREVCPDTVDQTQLSSTFLSVFSRVVFRSGRGSVTVSEDAHIPGNDTDLYLPLPPRVDPNECWTIQDPNPAANAGLGWQLSLGKLYQPRLDVFDDRVDFTERSEWVYMSPDGSEHTFYRTLHNDDPQTGSSFIWYTRDSSYLRLNVNPQPNPYGNMTIEFANGQKQYFTQVTIRQANGQIAQIVEEKLSRIEDQFGNYVNVQYLDTDGNGLKDDVWVVSDSIGRSQIVTFTSPAPGYPKAISDVSLEGFSSQFGPLTAHYNFDYKPLTIVRPDPHVPPGHVSGYDDNVKVNFLTAIKLPDGSKYAMPFDSSYSLANRTDPGVLIKTVLPTGGSLQWKYEAEDPSADLNAGYGYRFGLASAARHYFRSALGVRRRILTEGQNSYTWKYDPKLGEVWPSGCSTVTAPHSCSPTEFVNTITTPEGDHTRYYFSVWPFPYDSGSLEALRRGPSDVHSADYALPFTKDPRSGSFDPANKSYNDVGGKPLFLSEAVYDGAWNLKRSTYVRYETDAIDAGNGFGSMRDANSRVVASRTVFDDDVTGGMARYAEVQNTEFDGLGHYRRTTTYGNFGSGDGRTEVTTYNRDTDGTYHIYYIDPTTNQPGTGHNYTAFNEIRPWLLNLYDSRIASDYTQRSTTYFQFNGQGALVAKRTRKDFEPSSTTYFLSSNDVLVQYNYDGFGNVVGESYFGGDKPGHVNLDTANRFPSLNDSSSEYKLNYGHQCVLANGAPGTISVVNNTTYRGVNFKSTDDTIDCRTGLSKSSRDSAGVQTTYDYDALGRLKYITRQEGNYDQIQYEPSDGASLPKVTVTQLDRNNPNLTTGKLGQQIYIYDQLGRLITEKRLLPDGSFQFRSTGYNGMGWKTFVSEWNDGTTNANRKTVYSNFDPFGRATKITLPDGKVVTMGYLGDRQITRTTSIATQLDGAGNVSEQSSTSKEIYDRQGRLSQVIEPATANGQNVTWTYFYNVNDGLAGASATDPTSGAVQNRSFGYDNLGNLLTQSIPERPWSASSEYDTLGNAGKSFEGVHWLSFSYDSSARPTRVDELAGNWRPLKEFSYFDVNGGAGGSFALGKLATSTRHNYVFNPYEAHQNLSLGKSAAQSSTYLSSMPASLAVDGNTSGNGNYTHTTLQNQAWWQVDLGASYSLEQVNLFNRTDCCPERLSNFYVFVSDQPFNATDTVNTLLGRAGVSNYYIGGTAGSPTTIAVGRSGRYVRVQLAGTNYLSLAEVQVIGSNLTVYDIAVQEQYTYSGVEGALSKKVTSTNIFNGPSFEQSFTYDQLGNMVTQSYPKCTNATCVQSNAQRPWRVNYGYAKGSLTSVGGGAGEGNTTPDTYASSITYNINGTVATVVHRNGVVDGEILDLNYMQRPRQITVTRGTSVMLDTGIYSYDGAGNIKKIGNDWYLYDMVNRLKEGTALLSGATGDPLKRLKQQYDYDVFGNRLQTRTYNNVSLTGAILKDTYASNAAPATNRLALKYDEAGNVQGLQNAAPLYSYDAVNMIVTAPGLTYLYGPSEERFWVIDTKQNNLNDDNEETFTLRGQSNEVLREYKAIGGNAVGHWFWQKDYVYRASTLLAAETPNGIRHYHVDHLGSPRLITDANGAAFERMQFLPFGENSGFYENNESWSLMFSGEAVSTRLRFTGHEKDSDVIGLNYMHARYYWERSGRFMSVDPGGDTDPKRPQSWNLYSYVRNNPMNATDPTGRAGVNGLETALKLMGDLSDLIGLRPIWERVVPEARAPNLPPGACDGGMGFAQAKLERENDVSSLTLGTGMILGEVVTAGRAARVGKIERVPLENPFNRKSIPTASELAEWAKSEGWKVKQTPNGPPKFVDNNGVVRVTLKKGGGNAAGEYSKLPHVELRNQFGQRVGPAGTPVTGRSQANHTPIIWDLK